jgi:hypothetical protein
MMLVFYIKIEHVIGDNMVQVVYTNSKCSDLWEMFLKQNNKHIGWPIFFITDKLIPNFPEDSQYIYSEKDNYSDVWVSVLKKLNTKFFIYLQEDFILYDDVKIDKVIEYTEKLNNSDYSFVRLIKSGEVNQKITDTLYEISPNNPFIFAMQTTIWKTNDYINILENVHEEKWLETEKYREFMIKENIKGMCHYDNEPKRGGNHYDSNVYPYVATALVKGKWIMSEYHNELTKLLSENNIDKNKRGVI